MMLEGILMLLTAGGCGEGGWLVTPVPRALTWQAQRCFYEKAARDTIEELRSENSVLEESLREVIISDPEIVIT